MNKSYYLQDETLERQVINDMKKHFKDYEKVVAKEHEFFKWRYQFYETLPMTRQNFLRLYRKYKLTENDQSILPEKRGPKYKNFLTDKEKEMQEDILASRLLGANKYLIYKLLLPKWGEQTPCYTTIYNILKRNNVNRLNQTLQREEITSYIRENPGELAHTDCHYLSKFIIKNSNKQLFLVAVIDDCSRVAWCDIVEDIKSITVLFGILRCFTALKIYYNINFSEILTDNGSEFGGNAKTEKAIMENPVKRLFYELNIKHLHTKPYRPQTNGKVERLWRTIKEELINGTEFNSIDELKEELYKYLIFYNEIRPHSGINYMNPADCCRKKIEEKK